VVDFHAAYLTDPTAARKATERAAATGMDGWAIAWELAQTLPPAFGSHDATGARAILAPRADTLTPGEEHSLRVTARDGYYFDVNLHHDADEYTDMAATMGPRRRLRPGERDRRIDAICPACAGRLDEPEHLGAEGEVYHCFRCDQNWENTAPFIDLWPILNRADAGVMGDVAGLRVIVDPAIPDGIIFLVPSEATVAVRGGRGYELPVLNSHDDSQPRYATMADFYQAAMRRQAEHVALYGQWEPTGDAPNPNDPATWVFEPQRPTPEGFAELEEQQADQLRDLLTLVASHPPYVDVVDHPAMNHALRHSLVIFDPPNAGRRPHRRRRAHLTALGMTAHRLQRQHFEPRDLRSQPQPST